jgi:bifunctional non-homologous end joining protein LigD
MIMKSVELFFQEGSSDKLYNAAVVAEDDGTFSVTVAWGRRGATLNEGKKAVHVARAEADKAYDRVVREKTNKGYKPITAEQKPAATPPPAPPKDTTKKRAQLLTDVDDAELEALLANDDMIAQQKLDGIRVLAHVDAGGVRVTNRNGDPTDKVAAHVVAGLAKLADGSVVDGEVVGDRYWLFDVLAMGANDVTHVGYEERWEILADELMPDVSGSVSLLKLARGDEKRALLLRLINNAAEGIVFKHRAAPYTAGRPSSGGPQRKYKLKKSADVVIVKNAGNAYAMVVHHGASIVEVGKVFAGTTNESRAQIDALLAAGERPVAEVQYLYATDDHQLFQPVFVRLRDDKPARLCVRAQLKRTNRDVLSW